MKKIFVSAFVLAGTCLASSSLIADTTQTPVQNQNQLNTPQLSLRQQMFQLQQRVNKLYENKQDVTKEGVHTQFGDRISLSGGANVQTAFSDNYTPTSFTVPAKSNQTFDLNVAYLNFNALLTSWMRSYLSLSYEPNGVTTTTGGAFTGPEVEQAYVQFAKDRNQHFHLDVGKQYLPFGVYQRYPIVDSLTQSLAEINKVAAVAGINYNPFFASAYIFNMQGTLDGFGSTARDELMNGGAEVGLLKVSDKFGYEASFGFLNNMAETRFIYGIIKATNKSVDAFAGHFSCNYHHLGLITNTIFAGDAFSSQDITYNGKGAKPSAYEVELNYLIPVRGHPLVPAIAYEHSSQALFLSLAHYRYIFSLEYTINKYLSTTLELLASKNYGANATGTYATSTSSFATVSGNGIWNQAGLLEMAVNF